MNPDALIRLAELMMWFSYTMVGFGIFATLTMAMQIVMIRGLRRRIKALEDAQETTDEF